MASLVIERLIFSPCPRVRHAFKRLSQLALPLGILFTVACAARAQQPPRPAATPQPTPFLTPKLPDASAIPPAPPSSLPSPSSGPQSATTNQTVTPITLDDAL